MFTGLIEEVGTVRGVTPESSGVAVTVEARIVTADTRVGDSIAVSGCCLTVTALGAGSFTAHAGTETLARTTVSSWRAGRAVNLERALSASARLGGHFVQGHVDGVGRVLSVTPEGQTVRWRFSLPEELSPFVVEKGSIAVDGVSLTVTVCEPGDFEVAIIPHTTANTALRALRPSDEVNLETDVLAKYVYRMLGAMGHTSGGVTSELLREHGFC